MSKQNRPYLDAHEGQSILNGFEGGKTGFNWFLNNQIRYEFASFSDENDISPIVVTEMESPLVLASLIDSAISAMNRDRRRRNAIAGGSRFAAISKLEIRNGCWIKDFLNSFVLDRIWPEIEITQFPPRRVLTMERCILGNEDMTKWFSSQAYDDLTCFIVATSSKLKDLRITDLSLENECQKAIIGVLDEMAKWLDEIPPQKSADCRFGNIAFRDWHSRLVENAEEMVGRIIEAANLTLEAPILTKAIFELSEYLKMSFGSEMRLDYGTGHELNFAIFLMILFKLQALDLIKDSATTILIVFESYLKLVRRVQIQYRLEPAGSHGAWSLDDHQFLCFVWGSAQFGDSGQTIEPSSFPDPSVHSRGAQDFMFLSAINHINSVKNGPFFEHSNQLWSISAVPTWRKIQKGLMQMYRVEVLSKFPVVQHLVFGKYFSFQPCSRISQQ